MHLTILHSPLIMACYYTPLAHSPEMYAIVTLVYYWPGHIFLLITSNKQLCILSGTRRLLQVMQAFHLLLSLLPREAWALAARCRIDPRVVMMAERLLASGSDLGATVGLREAWIAIDFYLIQSFHLGSNLLPGAERQSPAQIF